MPIMRRSRFIPYHLVTVGSTVPPRRTWDPTAPGQVVESFERSPNSPSMFIVGLHDLALDEHYTQTVSTHKDRGLACPELRHPVAAQSMPGCIDKDGTIDWTLAGRAPRADELQEGDVLPKRSLHDPDHSRQSVSRVSLTHLGQIQLKLHDYSGILSPTYYLDETVEFPQDMSRFRDRRRESLDMRHPDKMDRMVAKAQALASLETVAWMRDTRSQVVFRFVRHPYGRGPWPPQVPAYDERRTSPDGGPIISQPPRPAVQHLHTQFLQRLRDDEVAQLVQEWGVPSLLENPPKYCNVEGLNANGHPQPRSPVELPASPASPQQPTPTPDEEPAEATSS